MTRPGAENPSGGFSGPSGGASEPHPYCTRHDQPLEWCNPPHPDWDAPLEDWQRDEGLAEESMHRLQECIERTLQPGFMDEALTMLGYRKDEHGDWRSVRPDNPPG